MLISCEKCSTTYVLDDKLIPAAGAPVQCTRCGHVFTARAPQAAAAPAATTMMFGAPAANNAGSGGDAAGNSGSANRTMMFGAGGGPAPAPASRPASSTMMFGTPAAPPAGASGPVPDSQGPANRTMMFGAPAVQPGAEQGGEAGSANKTMMFGAGGTDAPAPAPSSPANRTMMFGTPAVGNTPSNTPPPRTSGTMIFGAGGANQAGQTPPAASPNDKPSSSTMIFGAPAANAGAPPPGDAPGQLPKSSTMIFGGPSAPAAGAPKPKLTESTVRIGPEDLERMMREHEMMGRAGVVTPADGGEAVESIEQRHGKTQMFAMSDQGGPVQTTPPAGTESIEQRHGKTQMFAMSEKQDASIYETIPPEQQGASDLSTDEPSGPAVSTLIQPTPNAVRQPAIDRIRATDISTTTNPEMDPVQPEPRIELPPEESGDFGQTDPVVSDLDAAAAMRAQSARRNRIAGIVIALVLVGVALAVTWRVLGRQLMSQKVPIEAMQGAESALATLRFDDSKSKALAVTELVKLVKGYPDFVDAHAALVTALSLQLDDVQQRTRRLEKEAERINGAITRLNKEKTADAAERAKGLVKEVEKVIKLQRELAEEGKAIDTRAREAYRGLEEAVTRVGDPSTRGKLATIRAQALFHGVSGTDSAIVLSKRYESMKTDESDGWIELAVPEYVLNTRTSPEMQAEALAQLEKLHQHDSTFLRTYVLAARVHLANKRYGQAEDELEKVLTMRKDHDVAIELRDWISAHRDEKKPEPAPQ